MSARYYIVPTGRTHDPPLPTLFSGRDLTPPLWSGMIRLVIPAHAGIQAEEMMLVPLRLTILEP